MIPINVTSNQYVLGEEKLPAISASASKDKNGVIHISLVNIDASKAQDIRVNLDGLNTKSVTGRILSAKTLQQHNSFEEPNIIQPAAFKNATLKNNVLQATIPPFSVVVLTLN
jgi:alpha-N-arabinofuranosidase